MRISGPIRKRSCFRYLFAETNAGVIASANNVCQTIIDNDLDLDIRVVWQQSQTSLPRQRYQPRRPAIEFYRLLPRLA